MRYKFSCSSFFPVSRITQKPQDFSRLYLLPCLKFPRIRRQMSVVEITASGTSDADSVSAQRQPSHLFHDSVSHTENGIISAFFLSAENITAFVQPFSLKCPPGMPGIFKEKLLSLHLFSPGCGKILQIFPENTIEPDFFCRNFQPLQHSRRNPSVSQILQRRFFSQMPCRLRVQKQKQAQPQQPFSHKNSSVCPQFYLTYHSMCLRRNL